MIQEKGKRDRDRYAFLFDNMLILCKPTGQRKNAAPSGQEYRFKEKLLIKHLDVTDLEDTEGMHLLKGWFIGETTKNYVFCAQNRK